MRSSWHTGNFQLDFFMSWDQSTFRNGVLLPSSGGNQQRWQLTVLRPQGTPSPTAHEVVQPRHWDFHLMTCNCQFYFDWLIKYQVFSCCFPPIVMYPRRARNSFCCWGWHWTPDLASPPQCWEYPILCSTKDQTQGFVYARLAVSPAFLDLQTDTI